MKKCHSKRRLRFETLAQFTVTFVTHVLDASDSHEVTSQSLDGDSANDIFSVGSIAAVDFDGDTDMYSHGAVSTMNSVQQGRYEPDGIFLIDGSGQSWSFDIDVPTLHLGGGDHSASQAASRVVTNDFYGIDLYGADISSDVHHCSFGLQGCQFRHTIVEAGATETAAVQATEPDSFWLGYNPNLVEPGVVQDKMNEYAIAFVRDVVSESGTFLNLSTADKDLTIGDLRLSVNVGVYGDTEGLSVLLSAPQGRSFGVATETGELVNDFGTSGVLGRPDRACPNMEIGIRKSELVSGEFTLLASAERLSVAADYEIVLQSELKNGSDKIVRKQVLDSGVVQPGEAVEPISFSLLVPPLGDCNLSGDLEVYDMDCTSRRDSEALLSNLHLLAGDLYGDGDVAFGAFLTLSSHFGERGSCTEGNIDLRGIFNIDDFLILADNFGKLSTAVVAVPDPMARHLTCFALFCVLTFRPRNQDARTQR